MVEGKKDGDQLKGKTAGRGKHKRGLARRVSSPYLRRRSFLEVSGEKNSEKKGSVLEHVIIRRGEEGKKGGVRFELKLQGRCRSCWENTVKRIWKGNSEERWFSEGQRKKGCWKGKAKKKISSQKQ